MDSFSVSDDEFIAGTPDRVADQIIAQCRQAGAGHFLGILNPHAQPAELVLRMLREMEIPDKT
jgi:alkanesulfonate monooxygenase SsuD/methylene tetrahydromethanopterin reductase-like flavin-dependent oxidoreductase (luciferase family)